MAGVGCRVTWLSQGYQWTCRGDDGACPAGSDGGFEQRPFRDLKAEALAHARAAGHRVAIEQHRAREYGPEDTPLRPARPWVRSTRNKGVG